MMMDQPVDLMAAIAAATLGACEAGVDSPEIQTMQGMMLHYYFQLPREELWREFGEWVAKYVQQ